MTAAAIDAMCPTCGAGPFLSVEFYQRHADTAHPTAAEQPLTDLEREAGWTRDNLIAQGVRMAELGFGIVRVCHPTPGQDWPCSEGERHVDRETGEVCPSPGKRPIGKGWEGTAQRDPERVRTMLSNPGNHSYGIMPPPGCLELDVDGTAPAVLLAVAATVTVPLPPTRVHASGNGKHVFYRWPEGMTGGTGNLFGLVTRWPDRGMVVGPGSVHPSGVLYRVEQDRDIATLPVEWAQAAATWSGGQTGHQDEAEPGDPDWTVDAGQRHPFLKKQAARLRNTGLRGQPLADALMAINRERCVPPKPNSEIASLAKYYSAKDDDRGGMPFRFADEMPRPGPSTGIDAADLLAMQLAPLRMVIPGLMPEGTVVIASPPKVGKSCLVYQAAVEIAIGGTFLGERVTSGSVLYLALEDGQRRGQDRLRAALGDRTMPHGRLEVRWSAPAIGEGLEQEIEAWLDAHPDAALVAIDTLQKVRQRSNGKRGQYEVDVDDLGRLQALFRDRAVTLLIVHHSRKEAGDDFLASVSGTYGITGSVDTIIVIRRKRLETFGTIVVTGREIAEAELSVRFDGMLWQSAPASLPEASFERMEVYRTIQERGPIFPAAIAELTGLGRTSVQNMVAKLVDTGAVVRTVKGYQTTDIPFISPDDSSDSDSHQSHGGIRAREGLPCQACGQDRHPGRTCPQAAT